MQIREKQKFFSLRPPTRKRREISGWVQWVKWCLHIGQQMPCWQKVAAGPFWPCFACPKLGDAGVMKKLSYEKLPFFCVIPSLNHHMLWPKNSYFCENIQPLDPLCLWQCFMIISYTILQKWSFCRLGAARVRQAATRLRPVVEFPQCSVEAIIFFCKLGDKKVEAIIIFCK